MVQWKNICTPRILFWQGMLFSVTEPRIEEIVVVFHSAPVLLCTANMQFSSFQIKLDIFLIKFDTFRH